MVSALLVLAGATAGAQQLIEAEYFIDNDPGPGNGVPLSIAQGPTSTLVVNVPTGSLSPGLHALSVRYRQDNGHWGIATSSWFAVNQPVYPFAVQELALPIVSGEYYWDNDPGVGLGTPFFVIYGASIAQGFTASAEGLEPGEHILCVRTVDLGDRWSTPSCRSIVIDANAANEAPIAAFDYPNNPLSGVPVALSNTSQNVGTGTLYQWDIAADGTVDYTTFNATHTFAAPGIYPVSLTAINAPTALMSEAIAGFLFTNESLNDATGNFSALSPSSTPSFVRGSRGDLNGALNLGSDVTYSSANPVTTVSELTLSFWYNGGQSEGLIRLMNGTTPVFQSLQNGTVQVNSNLVWPNLASLHDSVWHHITVTWTPGLSDGLRFYLDGSLVTSAATSPSSGLSFDALIIGNEDPLIETSGLCDDVLVFDRSLTPEEVDALFTQTYVSSNLLNIEVELAANDLSLNGSTSFCSGDSLVLGAPAGSNFLWNTGETSAAITVFDTGNYQCVYTDVNGIDRISEEVSVTVYETPVVTLTTYETGIASGGSAGVAIVPGSSFLFDILWSNGSTDLVATDLGTGTHSVTVDDGVCPVTIDFEIVPSVSNDPIVAAEYFFDADPGPGNGTPFTIASGDAVGGFAFAPLGALPIGIHTVSTRVRYASGEWSVAQSQLFSVYEPFEDVVPQVPAEDLVIGEYFFDADPGAGNGTAFSIPAGTTINDNLAVDVAGLSMGSHILSVRTQDATGHWSVTQSAQFLVEPIFPNNLVDFQVPIVAAEYFFDNNDPGAGLATPLEIAPGTALNALRTLDLPDLAVGTHTVSLRTQDVMGHWSVTRTASFAIEDVLCTVPTPSFSYSAASAGVVTQFTNTSANVSAQSTYSWDIGADGSVESNDENPLLNFPLPGTYDLLFTVDNGGDCSVSTIVQVEVGPVLDQSIQADGSLEFCSGDSVLLTAPAGAGYVWNTGETSATISVGASGNYSCVYVDTNGNTVESESIEVVVHPSIQIDLAINHPTDGLSNGSAAVIATGGSGFIYSYSWSTGAETPLVSSLSAGNYSVSVTDGVCPQTIAVELINATFAPANVVVAAEYFWGADPGVGNGNAIPVQGSVNSINFADVSTAGLNPGFHLLSVRTKTAGGQWGVTRTLPVSLSDPNALPIESTPELIVLAEYFFDNNDPGPGNGIPLALGTPGATISQLSPVDVTGLLGGGHTLSVRVRDASGHWGITRTAPFVVEPTLPPNLPDYQWPIVAAEYFFNGADPGPGNATPMPLPVGTSATGSAAIDISSLSTGTHRVSVRTKDLAGHWSVTRSNTFSVIAPSCAMPTASFTYALANAGSNVVFTNTSSGLLNDATVSWDILADDVVDYTSYNATHAFAEPGIYPVALTIANGEDCFSTTVVNVEVGPFYPNAITPSGPLTFCSGNQVVLTAPVGSDFLWNTGETTASITVFDAGSYQVSYLDPNGNLALSAAITVEVLPTPQLVFEVTNPTNGSANGSAGVFASNGNGYLYSYEWSTGQSGQILTALSAGQYSVNVNDGVCSASGEVTLVNESASGLVAAEYFWDANDPGPGNGTALLVAAGSTVNTFADVATTGLSAGTHFLSVRFKDASGHWGVTRTLAVNIYGPIQPVEEADGPIVAAEYFFDNNDPGPGNATALLIGSPGSAIANGYNLDVAGLAPGDHLVSVRVQYQNGRWSVTRTSSFNTCFPPPVPEIATEDALVCSGSDLTLQAVETGSSLTWIDPVGNQYSGNTLSLTGLTPAQSGVYQLFAESEPGCYSAADTVLVTVEVPPAQPSLISGPTTVCVSTETATFFVEPIPNATGFDWFFEENGTVQPFTLLAGNNTNNVQVDFDGASSSPVVVYVTASNDCGSSTSFALAVEITCITCPGDFNGDGVVNISDLSGFLGVFGSACSGNVCPGDFNGDGTVNVSDLSGFLGVFGTSCN